MANLIDRIANAEQVSIQTICYYMMQMTEEKMRAQSLEFINDAIDMKVEALMWLIEDHQMPHTRDGLIAAIGLEQEEAMRFTEACFPLFETVQYRLDHYTEESPEKFFSEDNADAFAEDLVNFVWLTLYDGAEEEEEFKAITLHYFKKLILDTIDSAERMANSQLTAASAVSI